MRRCSLKSCNMPLSIYNKNDRCWWHYTINPDPPEEPAPKVMMITPRVDQGKLGGVKDRILACDPEMFKDMTILQIASMFDTLKPNVYNVVSRHGIEYKRLKCGRKKT